MFAPPHSFSGHLHVAEEDLPEEQIPRVRLQGQGRLELSI
jgi:hypothetical protein